jgi:exosome complex component RRP40
LVYSRILSGGKDMEPELVCIDANGKSSGLGVLKDGFMFKVPLQMCRRLLSSSNQFLKQISKLVPPFETAIGLNGRIWIKSNSTKQTILLVNAIKQYTSVCDEQTTEFVENLFKTTDLMET